ncbi:MAG: TetR/AcrR family transcriptional regulator, partial [Gordonia polyisoprenivorans]|nr:TetR/AcrR family transcriptional regulator [Gordonia polyisoprenivorans]
GLADDDAVCIARAITRMALSYVAMPPESDRDVAADLAAVMAPAVIAARGGETESAATPTTEE